MTNRRIKRLSPLGLGSYKEIAFIQQSRRE